MKKGFCVIIFLTFLLNAQSQILWTISGNHLKKQSYLFATHHKVPASFLDSIDGVYKCFNRSEMVVGETMIRNSDAMSLLLQKSRLPVGKNLHNYLTAVEFAKADSIISGVLKIDLNQLSVMKPSFIQMLFENEFYNKVFGQNDEFQTDSYFQIAGSEMGKKVTGLETMQKQMEIINDSLAIEDQVKRLLAVIQSTDSLQNRVSTLMSIYKAGQLDKLLRFEEQENAAGTWNAEKFKTYTEERNTVWMKQIPFLLNSYSCFIAVDAAHLPTENGLIALLQKSGYTVKPYVEKSIKTKKAK